MRFPEQSLRRIPVEVNRIMRRKIILTLVVVLLALAVVSTDSGIRADDQESAFDWREKCLIHCNDAYGGLEWIRPRQDMYQGWANCVLRCERQYWDKFDKETEIDK